MFPSIFIFRRSGYSISISYTFSLNILFQLHLGWRSAICSCSFLLWTCRSMYVLLYASVFTWLIVEVRHVKLWLLFVGYNYFFVTCFENVLRILQLPRFPSLGTFFLWLPDKGRCRSMSTSCLGLMLTNIDDAVNYVHLSFESWCNYGSVSLEDENFRLPMYMASW